MLETGERIEGRFPYSPSECPSTHGAAGYSLGDRVKDGKVVCCLCGSVLNPREPLPDWLTDGVSSPEAYSEYQNRKRQEYLRSRNFIERLADFLFGRNV